ncbi:hypothetical protein [Nocardioides marmoraquaticus]
MSYVTHAQEAIDRDLDTAVSGLADSGLTELLRALLQDVWSDNLGRFEPDELGDTAKSLGIQCSENIRERAKRRFHGDAGVASEDRWEVPGLVVSTPRDTLMMQLAYLRIAVMKVPMQHGRSPRWDRFRDWEYESQVRNDFALENSRALSGYTTPPDGQLEFDLGRRPARGHLRNFMVLWAGERDLPLTSGWLAVPTAGEMAFGAWRALWHDESSKAEANGGHTGPRRPSFDEQSSPTPKITLKTHGKRPAHGGDAGTGASS